MNQEIELWKPVLHYEEQYEVSNLGRIRSIERMVVNKSGLRTVPYKILSPFVNEVGYQLVILYNGNKQKAVRVHRLVATAFVPNPDGKREVNHNDGDKLNNAASNLGWMTRKENMEHAYRMGLRKKGTALKIEPFEPLNLSY
jgi:hypothetical protein